MKQGFWEKYGILAHLHISAEIRKFWIIQWAWYLGSPNFAARWKGVLERYISNFSAKFGKLHNWRHISCFGFAWSIKFEFKKSNHIFNILWTLIIMCQNFTSISVILNEPSPFHCEKMTFFRFWQSFLVYFELVRGHLANKFEKILSDRGKNHKYYQWAKIDDKIVWRSEN